MKIWKPDYYDAFACIADRCPDSCCKEWDVEVDAESAERYQKIPGALGEQLRAAIREEDGVTVIKQTDSRCPMWRADGLCQLQAEMGEEALCKVCREFPRIRHEYGNFTELGLELSCPEAARLILTAAPSDSVLTQVPESDEYDAEAMVVLLESRKTVLDFLKTSPYTPGETLSILMLYGYEVQSQLDGGEKAVLIPEETLAEAKSFAENGNLDAFLHFFEELEILTEAWKERLGTPEPNAEWNEMHIAMARYLVRRYWLQAVSDYDLVGRVKLIIASCLVVKFLGGDTVDTAHLYSKEIENDADNVCAILDGAYESSALADRGLLDLLLK